MKQINMEYPSYRSGNDTWDGKPHKITPNGLYEFTIGDNTYYLMLYRDETYNVDEMQTILSVDYNGNMVKSPLDDYSRMEELVIGLMGSGNLNPVDLDILPDDIELGNELEIESLIHPQKQEEIKPQVIERVDTQALYIAHIVDSIHRYIPTSIYNQYLSGMYETRPNERNIEGVDCILVTQEDIDYISRVSHQPNYKPEYKPYGPNLYETRQKPEDDPRYLRQHQQPPTPGGGFDFNNPDPIIVNGIVMDYPDMRDFPYLPNNRLWDGRTHSISPVGLQRFNLNGRTFYYMNYIDNDYNSECITLLEEIDYGNIVKIPLDNYDKLPELLSRVHLTEVSTNILPNHIRLGRLLEIDYLIGLTNGLGTNNDWYEIPPLKPGTAGGSIPPEDPSINIKKEKFEGKQALFTVFRGLDGTLRVDATEYDFYLNDILDAEKHPVIKGKVVLSEEDLETIYNNSKNPELMPDFEIEYSEYSTRTMDIDKFNVYITNEGLELDTFDYSKFVDLGLLEEREINNKRVKITKEEIHNIEKYVGEWHYYAKLVNEIQLKPEVAFTIYNVNSKHFEVTNNIYDRYLKQYIDPDNNKQTHGGWNENGDYFTVITEEDIKTVERESHDPKLTPTILYKERKLRDIYGNEVDENTNNKEDKNEKNEELIEEPPIKKRNKVKSMIKNTKNWAKEHPVLATIAVGLAVTLGSQLALSGLMMVNSTLWSVLGGTGPACSALHSVNMALSKIVGFGAFKFTEAGTYTLAGKTGALALYSGVGANLTTAALSLGGIGKLIANKFKKKEQKEATKENTTLTREQIAELVKQEVEKATQDLVKENKALKAENALYKQQIEELVREQELSASRTK